MSEPFKDVLALVVGTSLLMLVWFAIGGGPYRLSPDVGMESRAAGSRPGPAIRAVSVGRER